MSSQRFLCFFSVFRRFTFGCLASRLAAERKRFLRGAGRDDGPQEGLQDGEVRQVPHIFPLCSAHFVLENSFKCFTLCSHKSYYCKLLPFDLWPSDCRMIMLETRQTEDQSGLSNLYLLEVAENYVLLPWRSWARWESSRCVWTPPLLLSRIKTNTRGGDVCVIFTLDGDQCGFIFHQRRKWCQQETVRTFQSRRHQTEGRSRSKQWRGLSSFFCHSITGHSSSLQRLTEWLPWNLSWSEARPALVSFRDLDSCVSVASTVLLLLHSNKVIYTRLCQLCWWLCGWKPRC